MGRRCLDRNAAQPCVGVRREKEDEYFFVLFSVSAHAGREKKKKKKKINTPKL
jgi:hypothetical protein